MTRKTKKVLIISSSILCGSAVILGSYFGAIAAVRYKNYIKPNLPREYEKEEYKFSTTVYDLNEQAKQYFKLNENIIRATKNQDIKKDDALYKFVFNHKYRTCGHSLNTKEYINTFLKVNKKLYDDIFKNINFNWLPQLSEYYMSENIMQSWKHLHNEFKNNILNIVRQLTKNIRISLNIDFNTKKGYLKIENESKMTNIEVKFNVNMEK